MKHNPDIDGRSFFVYGVQKKPLTLQQMHKIYPALHYDFSFQCCLGRSMDSYIYSCFNSAFTRIKIQETL